MIMGHKIAFGFAHKQGCDESVNALENHEDALTTL